MDDQIIGAVVKVQNLFICHDAGVWENLSPQVRERGSQQRAL